MERLPADYRWITDFKGRLNKQVFPDIMIIKDEASDMPRIDSLNNYGIQHIGKSYQFMWEEDQQEGEVLYWMEAAEVTRVVNKTYSAGMLLGVKLPESKEIKAVATIVDGYVNTTEYFYRDRVQNLSITDINRLAAELICSILSKDGYKARIVCCTIHLHSALSVNGKVLFDAPYFIVEIETESHGTGYVHIGGANFNPYLLPVHRFDEGPVYTNSISIPFNPTGRIYTESDYMWVQPASEGGSGEVKEVEQLTKNTPPTSLQSSLNSPVATVAERDRMKRIREKNAATITAAKEQLGRSGDFWSSGWTRIQ